MNSTARKRPIAPAPCIRRSMGGYRRRRHGARAAPQPAISAKRPLLAAGRAFDNASDRASIRRAVPCLRHHGGLPAASRRSSPPTSSRATRTCVDEPQNQIGTVTKGTAEMRTMLGAVSTTDRSFSSIGATATLYTRIQRSAPNHKPEDVLQLMSRRSRRSSPRWRSDGRERDLLRSSSRRRRHSIRLGGDEMRAVLETPRRLRQEPRRLHPASCGRWGLTASSPPLGRCSRHCAIGPGRPPPSVSSNARSTSPSPCSTTRQPR